MIPIILLIGEPNRATTAIFIGSGLGFMAHLAAYIFYRYGKADLGSLAATVISGCIIVEVTVIKILSEIFTSQDAIMYLIMGVMTLGVVTGFTVLLRHLAREIETRELEASGLGTDHA